MSTKILIAPDSFKGCADSVSLAVLIQNELKEIKNFEFEITPISDGGDGFLNVCKNNFQLEEVEYYISTPFDETMMKCKVGYDRLNKSIFIESADVLGLKVIPIQKRKPLKLSSKGLGELILKIKYDVESKKLSCDKIYLGIGGTGTVDFGLGMCSIFGLKIFDFYDKQLEVLPENYFRIGEIDFPKFNLPFQIIPVIDVNNSLLGQDGAITNFAPQKGAAPSDIKILELGFNKIINILIKKNLISEGSALSGAGGGIAAAIQVFYNSKLLKAKDFILDTLSMKKEIDNSEIIITGEGKFDSQSLLGKGAYSITEYALERNKKVFFICGKSEIKAVSLKNENFSIIELSNFMSSADESIQNVKRGISLACELIRSKL